MSIEPAPGLSGILKFGLAEEGDHQIVDGGHHFSRMADGHTSSIFLEGNIAAIVQPGFIPQ